MRHTHISQMEDWLSVLIASYEVAPSKNVVQCILYYIDRILLDDECNARDHSHCQYHRMKAYWHRQKYMLTRG
ncbi:hypothetical protein [Thalassotalea atypica]|uniref:hypothetical protein n=1 Tax=Thalassotalea atypica TaxID=2054316 RepID=UPI002573E2FE|nr:hypothetical protein [Thalassotalea atypica]